MGREIVKGKIVYILATSIRDGEWGLGNGRGPGLRKGVLRSCP